MSTDSPQLVTTVSKRHKRHAEMLQLALWEPPLQPGAALAMPACALPLLDRPDNKPYSPSWQIHTMLQ